MCVKLLAFHIFSSFVMLYSGSNREYYSLQKGTFIHKRAFLLNESEDKTKALFKYISIIFFSQLVALDLEFKLVQNQSTQLRNRMKDFAEESENRRKYIFLHLLSSLVSQMEFITVSHRIRARGEALGEQMLRSSSQYCHINCEVYSESLNKMVNEAKNM